MEEDLEDLSSLHNQLFFPPCEPSHQQREYELERHLALMDEPPRTPGRNLMDMDLGNLTIEHFPSQETKEDCFLLMEEEKCPEEDFFDIGIEASDLGSLLQQFEQTEAALMTSPENRATPKSICKGSTLQLPDPGALAKKITPVKRKSTILLEPQAIPSKRLRSKDSVVTTADRECVSLPGSRASSPVTIHHKSLSVICSAEQGFDYFVMDHDYCTNGANKEQIPSRASSAASSPRNDSNQLSVEERKAVYKQKYRIKKKDGKTSQIFKKDVKKVKEHQQLNLINKLPDYIQPMPEVVPAIKIGPSREKINRKSAEMTQADSQNEKNKIIEQEKPTFFDKIPDYFIGKHMYQEISKVQEEEVRKKEEEMAKCEDAKVQDKDLAKDHHRSGYRTRHLDKDKMKIQRLPKTSTSEGNVDIRKCDAITSAVDEVEISKELNPVNGTEPKDESCNIECPEDKSDATDKKCKSQGRTRCSHKKNSCSERRSRSHSLCSSCSRSSSKSSFRSRSRSSSLSWSSYSRERCRQNSRVSRSSLSSSSSYSRSRSRSRSRSFSRSRSRSRSYRGHRCRRYSTYSSASRSSSCSRSRSRSHSRSHSRSRHWRPRSRSRSHSKLRSRSRSHHSNRRHRRNSHRHRSRSRSRRRRRSISIELLQEERRKRRMKEQDEQWADRRVVYIGRIPYGTTQGIIRRRFVKYGEIERITLHFRDVGDNYAFVTYVYKCDAYAAVEGAKNDSEEPQFDICFGGRRQFCKNSYEDLDSMGHEEMALEFGYGQASAGTQSNNAMETDFDRLLREAMKKTKR